MVFGYSVAGRTRSRKAGLPTSSRSGGVGNKKGAAFRAKSRPGRPRKSGNGGKVRPLARKQIDEEVIDITGSSSSDDSSDESSQDSGSKKTGGGRSGGVRISGGGGGIGGIRISGGDAESVINIGTTSSDEEDEAGPSRAREERLTEEDEAGPSRAREERLTEEDEVGPSIAREERLPDIVPGLEENATPSESDSESDESDDGEDDDFRLGSDQRSVESEEEEEDEEEEDEEEVDEEEEDEEEEDEEEDSPRRSEKSGATRPETLFGDGALGIPQVEEVIDITSSEDNSDDDSSVPRQVVVPGAVASRTRSRRSGGARNHQTAPYHGRTKNAVEKGKSIIGPQKKRKTAAVISKSKKSDEQPDSCNSIQSRRSLGERNKQCDKLPASHHDAVKNSVEKDLDMLSNRAGPQKKQKTAPDISEKRKTAAVISKSKKSDEHSNSCNSTQSKRSVGEKNQQSDKLPASYHDTAKNSVEKDQGMLSNSPGPQEEQKTAPDISKLKKSDEHSNSGNSDHASSTEVMEKKKGRPRSTRKHDFFRILADSILKKNGEGIDEVQEQRRVMELLPVNFPWPPEEKEPVEKTEMDKEMDDLWQLCNLGIQADQIGSSSVRDEEPESVELDTSQLAKCRRGEHWLFLDEEIGMRCKYCSYIETEIRDYCEPLEILPPEARYRSYLRDQRNGSLDGFEVGAPESCAAESFSPICDGTVWDLIPGIKNQMYPHQQEAFEFMWKNLAGSVSLDDLRSSSLQERDIGGCIISHAPGTGKTRLTLVFLQAYLELFPDSRPVIIAPAGLLLTWQDEITKWGVGVSFHNLNTELSMKEDVTALRMLESHRLTRNTNSIRMVKLYSWSTTKSILLVSYDLFVKLTGANPQSTKEIEKMREILLKQPGVVILDEGHIPRNQDSQVWNLVIKLETKKRVILSGTPFQNNFEELLNTLHLVRQKIAESIPRYLKKFCQRGSTAQIDDGPAGAIEKIKSIMAPYVHIHKGSILQKSLPGRKDCVVVLNPGELQLEVLKSFYGGSENDPEADKKKRKDRSTFDFEHKQALISVHPSLALGINFSPEEKSLIFRKEEELKKHELNPSKGVKTRFLKEFIQLCISMDEKVLVFSQYIKPLDFIALQLGKAFEWTTGREVLEMVGNLGMSQRQSMIKVFNDPGSDARVLLASTKACSEGINLVGASRVILLDVVWNPAVERQAISRAYRLGQKKMVYTYHLIMKETYEWEKYQKQAHKDRLSELVFSAGTSSDGDTGEKRVSTISEDRILEEMTSHPKLRALFHQIKYHPKRMEAVEDFGPTT